MMESKPTGIQRTIYAVEEAAVDFEAADSCLLTTDEVKMELRGVVNLLKALDKESENNARN